MVKKTIEVDLKWWEARQNNSGGSFTVDDNVAHWVLVQATSAEEAERKLNALTERSGYDFCPCCGERWYIDLEGEEGFDEPSVYGKPLSEFEAYFKDEARLHYFDGTVEKVVLNTKVYK